ncbi:nitrilase family protein [Jeongeupia naejangsanensis]|uniref:Nitrilase family protein n=1 Tax=Jeongeupia naejangsanensis TaxID=613195 RepID=A0ABS2BPW3_9NEIS|nr:nitrilase family protein [Jeongeupia naejangsanensis]MBM3117470.1 nitrilase family protein [Jeongeupia naejangsanensis]
MTETLRVAAVQFQHRANDKTYNLGRIADFALEAARRGVQLLALPEMCITGYWHVPRLDADAVAALAEPLGGPSVSAVRALALRHGIGIGAGFIERGDDGRLYNAYAVCLPDGEVHCHRKLHAFEHPAIASGDRYTVFDTPWGVRVGVLICWDNNLVENARATALLGATVLLAPHQTGGTDSRSPHAMKKIPLSVWRNRHTDPAAVEAAFRGPNGREWLLRWLPARAHDNGLFIVFANGIGEDDDEVRTGNAMVLDPYGRILAETWAAADALVDAELDLGLLPLCSGRRWMQGRRPELYGVLTEGRPGLRNARAARFSDDPVDVNLTDVAQP